MNNWLFALIFVWVALWGLAYATGDYPMVRALRVATKDVLKSVCLFVYRFGCQTLLGTSRSFKAGDPVVYFAHKVTTRPGPRAEQVFPCACGDTYSYVVRKLWMVSGVQENGRIEVVTPRGKRRLLSANDPGLRRARPWDILNFQLRWHKRLPSPI